ncbi:1-phosphofructokinase family hexose kinase [Aurantiacibacter marinus]|uniref:Phosphofructokinase n=1 Tax=Aurantiacibacter marinus TaxID=874156 RepID=A0A0H0XKQ7_9SPHN|nr:1-phosphofructokinase family hexose kinase [Aurantiacibacter marinus]KLI62914.1 1-phosphofructokinase [Aurantiacibacter marinus]
MNGIAALTMNPAIDVAYSVEQLEHTRKLRADDASVDPGGGGINVARVLVRLGNNVRCFYPSGGAGGVAFDNLVDLHQLVKTRIPIAGSTRFSTAILERSSGHEFRFSSTGPELQEAEWQACLDAIATMKGDYLVASGSLPPGVPTDFYASVCRIAHEKGARFVLDTSGPPLKACIAQGGVFLAKPGRLEFEAMVGRPLADDKTLEAAAREIVDQGLVENLAVTMGEGGALLATREATLRLSAAEVEARSTVGAGDSFVAGMVHAFAIGSDAAEAFRYGVAAGAAAVLTPGTDLCRPADMERLLEHMPVPQ